MAYVYALPHRTPSQKAPTAAFRAKLLLLDALGIWKIDSSATRRAVEVEGVHV